MLLGFGIGLATKAASQGASSLPVTGSGTLAAQVEIFGFGADALGTTARAASESVSPWAALAAVGVGIAVVAALPTAAFLVPAGAIAQVALPFMGGAISQAALTAIIGGVLEVGAAGIASSVVEPFIRDVFDGMNDYINNSENLGDLISDFFTDLLGPIMPDWPDMPMFTISPLVFDLDSDGVELTELGIYNTYFDLRGNGQAVLTGWVAPDDGLLALDINGDGGINDISELFGTSVKDGFAVLKAYDSNNDGVIDAQDAVFDDLLIWQDVNRDGRSQADELKSLSDWGIASISLGATRVSDEIAGNGVTHESSYTMTNGQSHQVPDVWFDYNPRHSHNNAANDNVKYGRQIRSAA